MPHKRHLLLLACLILVTCSARQPGAAIKPGYNMYSPGQDIELGKQAASEVVKQLDVVKNAVLQDYIDKIGQSVASRPEAGPYPYEFTLINDPNINAFALPGGPIFVNSGLIAQAENEAQVVGVLAHEVSHVVLRHGTNQASKASLMQIPAVLAGQAIGDSSALRQLAQVGLGLGLNALMMKYSRTAEKQADAVGSKLLAGAGYNPIEMAHFFEKLEGQGGSRPPQILSSHPNPGNRVKFVQAELATFPAKQYDAGTGQFEQMKRLVAQLPKPKPPAQATAPARSAAPSAPSGGFQQLDAGRFRVHYPGGWEVFGDQQSNVVTIAPRQGLVQSPNGGVGLGYGVVLSYYQPQTRRANLSSATRELAGQLISVNPGLQAQGQQQGQVAGRPALLTTMIGRSPFGGRETNFLLTVAQPEGLFYMVFVSPEQGQQQLMGTFENMLHSIEFAR